MIIEIGKIIKVSSGGTPSRKNNKYFDDGNIPWIKTGDLKPKYLNKASEYITELGLNNSSAKLFPARSVLVAMYGATIGACSILNFEAASNQACAALLPTNEVHPEYLYYYLKANKQSIINRGVGGAQPNISATIIKSLKIPLPPLKTQQRIAGILDDAAALHDKTAQLLTEYDLLAQSVFLEMFGDPVINEKGWEKKALKGFLIDVKNGITRRPKKKEDLNGDIVLKLKHVRSNYINYDCENRIKLNDIEKLKFRINHEDLLFIRVNGNPDYVGRCALHNDENHEVFFNDHIMRVRYDKTKYNGQFLSLYLNYPYGQLEIAKRVKTSAGQHTINQGGLEKLNLIIPPIKLQNEFADKIALIEQQKALAKQELQESENLFNCLLQKAFKGEL
jgi:type I restriction enzyme S subunit